MRVTGLAPLITSLVVAAAAFVSGGDAAAVAEDRAGKLIAWPSGQRDAYRGVHSQLPNVAVPIATRYPNAAAIGLGIVVVPDPLVPRYRRMYDLSIAALELGMLKAGYVLDRYGFPWDEELRSAQKPQDGSGEAADTGGLNSGSYGLIVFRCDHWRGDPCGYPNGRSPAPGGAAPGSATASSATAGSASPGSAPDTYFRALYVVTETATAGVARRQLRCAIRKLESQVSQCLVPDATCPVGPETSDYQEKTALLEYPLPACRAAANGAVPLVVLGPNFSGSLDSIGTTVDSFPNEQRRHVCLIASSPTDHSNAAVSKVYPNIAYQTTALEDDKKIRHIVKIANLLDAHGGRDSGDVAILAEASTFGRGICAPTIPTIPAIPAIQSIPTADQPAGLRERAAAATTDPVVQFCQSPKFYFPPTLADIRFGLQQQQQAEEASELAGAARQLEHDRHLPLETAAENGSEFPESHQSAVTAAGIQLHLDQVFAALVESAPKIVVVAATDVRDRLFLFDQLREKLPRAMLIDLEADNLLAHPEFLHASRGALAAASVNLTSRGRTFGCESSAVATPATRASWSTDNQGILAENVARLQEPSSPATRAEVPCSLPANANVDALNQRQAAMQAVTFNGLTPVSYAFPDGAMRCGGSEAKGRPCFALLPTTEYLSLVFCVALPGVWLWPWVLQPMRDSRRVRVLKHGWMECIVLGVVSLCCLPALLLAFGIALDSSAQSAHPLAYWIGAIEIIGVIGLWRCYVQIRHALWSANHRYYSGNSLAGCLALIALLFAFTPIWMSRKDTAPEIDPLLLNALGFDPYSGLGFYLVVALTLVTLLYTSAILATRTWIVRRNFHLLFLAHEQVPGSTPFVVKKEQQETEQSRLSAPHCYRPLPVWIIVLVTAVVILVLAAPGLLDGLGGPRLTVFGPFAARVAVFALSATTLCAAVLVAGVYGAGRRIKMLSGYVRSRALDHLPSAKPRETGEILNAWAGGAEMPIMFPATPVLARVGAAGVFRRRTLRARDGGGMRAQRIGTEWARSLSEILFKGNWDTSHRLALFALLAAEVSLFRWIALGAILCALASVTIAYLYPIEADTLLVLNLVLLATTGVLSAYLAVQFECDEVLSFVLCNRPKKPQMSIGLFTYLASPFIALAAAAAIVSIPGVVDWAGGVLAMLRALGVHG